MSHLAIFFLQLEVPPLKGITWGTGVGTHTAAPHYQLGEVRDLELGHLLQVHIRKSYLLWSCELKERGTQLLATLV